MASPPTRLARAAAGALFGAVARVRGDRPLHPAGVAFAGELVVGEPALPGTELFGRPGRHRALARFSRGFGIPERLPGILSVAIKVPDAYGRGRDHDLMLTATGERPVLRRLFAAGRSHGPWRAIARHEPRRALGPADEDGLAFSSSSTGGGIAPQGFVDAVRDAAYEAAARGRGA